MDAKLVLHRKKAKPTVIRLKKLPMTIGRGREADLTIAHPMISRLHCELYVADGALCIRDLGSLNGTFVGDEQISEASLESGDELIIGSAHFKVVINEEAAAVKEIEAAAVTADEATDEEDGSVIEAMEFDELETEELEEAEEIEEIEEAEAEEAEAEVEQEMEGEETEGEEMEEDLTEFDFSGGGEEEEEEEEVEETEAVDELTAEQAGEQTESQEADEEEEVSGFKIGPPEPSEGDEEEEPEDEAAGSSEKVDLGLSTDADSPDSVDSDDDDLQNFLAGLN